VIEYPKAFEDWWLQRCSANASPGQVVQRHAPVVAHLSDLFTIERGDTPPDAYRSSLEVNAYGLFFFPQSFCRAARVMQELIREAGWRPAPDRPLRILDLGCGSGGTAFGVMHSLLGAFPGQHVHFIGVDRSGENLEAAGDFFRDFTERFPNTGAEWIRRDVVGSGFSFQQTPFHQPWDLVLMGFSFGEFVAGLEAEASTGPVTEVFLRLAPGGSLVILEPALQETAERLERIRDGLVEREDLQILGPCLHQQACPARAGAKFWCHEVRRWHPPEIVAALNSNLHREIRFLKFSFLALQRTGEQAKPEATAPSPEGYFRIVSPVRKQSGQIVCQGCAANGQIQTYEWLTRNLSRQEIKNNLGLERGDRVMIDHLKPLGTEGRWRVV